MSTKKLERSSAFKDAQGGLESRALAKGLKLLEILSSSSLPVSLSGIATEIGLGKPSALRLIRTLAALQMITRVDGDQYVLNVPWPATRAHFLLQKLRLAALEPMRELGANLGETVALSYLFDDHIRVVEVIESTHHIRMSNHRERILQPYASSLGKAIAAFQTRDRAQHLLDVYGIYSLTPSTITELAAIRDEFERVRERGYAEDREETVVGGFCVGAPITLSDGEVVASISASTPGIRYTERYAQGLPELVTGASARISKNITKLDSAAA